MAELRDNKQSTIVEIFAEGDVILVVGPEKLKLRAHSLFLKTASRPFSAMFGPDWKEGRGLFGRDGPVELPLPEENGAALKLICAIIHHQNNMVPETLAADDVLRIAVTADKYDCIDALKFASRNWLQPRENKAGDLILLTAAAYLFQNAPAFKEVTKALVLNYGDPYLALSCEEVESAMPWSVFCLLEEQRSLARLRLADILLAGINDGTGLCVHKCGWSSKYAYAYLKLLERQDLWPMSLLCIAKAIEVADKMPDPIPEEPSVACTYQRNHAAPEYRKNRHWSLDQLNDSIGLCLYCVRSEYYTEQKGRLAPSFVYGTMLYLPPWGTFWPGPFLPMPFFLLPGVPVAWPVDELDGAPDSTCSLLRVFKN